MCALLNELSPRRLLPGTPVLPDPLRRSVGHARENGARDSPPGPAPVSPFLVVVTTAVAVALALLGVAATLARRRIGLVHVAGALVLEALLVVQTVLVVIALLDGERPEDVATFVGYLAGVLLVPVAGLLWARTERTRWAGTVIAVAGGAVAVMVWRLLKLWEATGG